MDEIARYNKERWEELACANVQYSRPRLDLDETAASEMVDPHGLIGDVAGKRVLCLASGGGQQSAAFALLGAGVTVLDLSETQLDRDRLAADHYGCEVELCHGDMRDLSRFDERSFEVVFHAHSLNFVPDALAVFDQVARVVKLGGIYRVSYTNPFIHAMMTPEWHGAGYAVRQPYVNGEEITRPDPCWDVEDENGNVRRVKGPREWRHALSAVVNGLIGRGFSLRGLWEAGHGDPQAEPGSWSHFTAMFPPWVVLWTQLTANNEVRDLQEC